MQMERKQQQNDEMQRRVKELQHQVDELKELVNTLLSVIVEELMAFTACSTHHSRPGMMEVCM